MNSLADTYLRIDQLEDESMKDWQKCSAIEEHLKNVSEELALARTQYREKRREIARLRRECGLSKL